MLELVKLAREARDPEYLKRLEKINNDPLHQKHRIHQAESWSPGPNNSCKTTGCKGEVVKSVAGLNSSGYFYRTPACDICNRKYLGAENVRITGMAEFREIMNTPYNI